MLASLPRKTRKPVTIILLTLSTLLGFVWTYLEKILPISTKQELSTIYLVQVSLSVIIIVSALIAFIIILLVTKNEKEIKIKSKEQKLDTPSEQVLLTFFDEETELSVLHFERLCISQGINGAQYYLDELLKHEYIHKNSSDHDPNVTYSITAKGRKYIMEKHITRV